MAIVKVERKRETQISNELREKLQEMEDELTQLKAREEERISEEE